MEQEKKILLATDDLYTYMVEGWGSPEKFLEFFNNEREKEGEASIEDWTDKRVQSWFDTQIEVDFDDFRDDFGDRRVLVIANLGLWYGRRDGGQYGILKELLYKMFEDSNDVYFNEEDKTLRLEATHHDGTNIFKIYELTKEGWDYLENEALDVEPREAHKHVLETEGMIKPFEF